MRPSREHELLMPACISRIERLELERGCSPPALQQFLDRSANPVSCYGRRIFDNFLPHFLAIESFFRKIPPSSPAPVHPLSDDTKIEPNPIAQLPEISFYEPSKITTFCQYLELENFFRKSKTATLPDFQFHGGSCSSTFFPRRTQLSRKKSNLT